MLTEEGEVARGDAVSIIAPGEVGYLGVLHNHAPLVTTLRPGKLIWQQPSGARQVRHVGAGLLEVSHNQVTLLTDRVTDAAPHAPSGGPHG